MLSQFLPDDADNTNVFKPSILKIRGKTLVYGNVVYQIHNISSIGLVDLTTIKPIPRIFFALIFIGIALFIIPNIQAKILAILVLAFVAWLFYQHHKNKITERYGMTIYTNHGTKAIFSSRSQDYIKKVIFALYNVMNSDELKAITFNFETETLSIDKSIQIGTNIGSPIISGHVTGDVVSEI